MWTLQVSRELVFQKNFSCFCNFNNFQFYFQVSAMKHLLSMSVQKVKQGTFGGLVNGINKWTSVILFIFEWNTGENFFHGHKSSVMVLYAAWMFVFFLLNCNCWFDKSFNILSLNFCPEFVPGEVWAKV